MITIFTLTSAESKAKKGKRRTTMLNFLSERQERRLIILKGISQNLKHSEIADQLGVDRWVIGNDLKFMRYHKDFDLKEAQKSQEQIRANKQSLDAYARNERFLLMTGMTIKEKTFRNMINFYKPELMTILKSKNQSAAIMNLPKSLRRTLINNEIIKKWWHNHEITLYARNYLP